MESRAQDGGKPVDHVAADATTEKDEATPVEQSTSAVSGDLTVVRRNRRRHDDLPLAGRRLLVIGINYAPELTGIAPYTTLTSRHLAATGADVEVLTGVPHYPHWTVPEKYRRVLRSTERVEAFGAGETDDAAHPGSLTVRRLRHYVPARQSALRRAAYELSFLLNAAAVGSAARPDAIVAVTPSLGGAVVGARMAARHGCPLLVVVQDLMANAARQSGIQGGGKVAGLAGAVERYALVRADLVAVVSEAFRSTVEGYGVPGERISLLPNWTRIEAGSLDREAARADLGWEQEPFTVVHTGNMGLKQDLGNVVQAARLLRDEPGVRFVLVGDGSERPAVQAMAADLPNVRFVPPLGEEQYPHSLAAGDLLLVNERPGVGEMSLPSKLTSYLTAGRPVLAAVEPGGSTAAELARTHGAAEVVAPGDPAALVRAIRTLRDDPARRAEMSVAGQAYAQSALDSTDATDRLDALMARLLGAS